MTIGFNSIPLQINTPGQFVEFDPSRATKGLQAQPHNVLIIGQKLSGAAAADTVYAVDSIGDAEVLFGANSQVTEMVRAYKAVDPLSQLYVVGVADNGAGVQATGSITWTGTATESRELVLYVAGRRVPVAVSKNDTAATIETNALAALALVADMVVTSAADAGTGVDFTASHKGSIGNQIAIGHSQLPNERVPAGLTVTVTAMASGATDPTYTAAITAMAEDWYATVVSGLCTSTACGALVTELESRWGPMRQIEGVLFANYADTRANLTTLGNGFNSQCFVLGGMEVSALMSAPWEVAAATGAASARQAQVDPARALTGVVLAGQRGARRGAQFTRAQRDTLLSDGVSTYIVGLDGRLAIERLVTTYQLNAASLPDSAVQDLTSVRTLAALRFTLRARISSKFGNFKLANDGNPIPPGQPIVTPSIIRGEIIALFQDWQAQGWVENLDQFKSELLVERDPNDPNRVNALIPPDLINNLLVFAGKISFIR